MALHENHAIQLLDITKNKTVSFSMHEAARLAAETNRMRHKGMLALDTLATLYETVEVIKGELGLMASMPIEDALNQACALLGVADGGEDAADGVEAQRAKVRVPARPRCTMVTPRRGRQLRQQQQQLEKTVMPPKMWKPPPA